jgi:hypothetical protein
MNCGRKAERLLTWRVLIQQTINLFGGLYFSSLVSGSVRHHPTKGVTFPVLVMAFPYRFDG